jgi:hypothetical protein
VRAALPRRYRRLVQSADRDLSFAKGNAGSGTRTAGRMSATVKRIARGSGDQERPLGGCWRQPTLDPSLDPNSAVRAGTISTLVVGLCPQLIEKQHYLGQHGRSWYSGPRISKPPPSATRPPLHRRVVHGPCRISSSKRPRSSQLATRGVPGGNGKLPRFAVLLDPLHVLIAEAQVMADLMNQHVRTTSPRSSPLSHQ